MKHHQPVENTYSGIIFKGIKKKKALCAQMNNYIATPLLQVCLYSTLDFR